MFTGCIDGGVFASNISKGINYDNFDRSDFGWYSKVVGHN